MDERTGDGILGTQNKSEETTKPKNSNDNARVIYVKAAQGRKNGPWDFVLWARRA